MAVYGSYNAPITGPGVHCNLDEAGPHTLTQRPSLIFMSASARLAYDAFVRPGQCCKRYPLAGIFCRRDDAILHLKFGYIHVQGLCGALEKILSQLVGRTKDGRPLQGDGFAREPRIAFRCKVGVAPYDADTISSRESQDFRN